MSEVLIALLQVNLAVAAAVALVIALRRPVRRAFGPRVAYGLWTLAPLSALAMLLPARVVRVAVAATPEALAAPMTPAGGAPALQAVAGPDLWALAAAVWIVGARWPA